MPAWKTVYRAEVGIETGFHAGVGRSADGKKSKSLKTHLGAVQREREASKNSNSKHHPSKDMSGMSGEDRPQN